MNNSGVADPGGASSGIAPPISSIVKSQKYVV
jgi:hypothetical protein